MYVNRKLINSIADVGILMLRGTELVAVRGIMRPTHCTGMREKDSTDR